MPTTAHKIELLTDAFDSHARAECRVSMGDLSQEAVRSLIQAQNRLFDRCIDSGMKLDDPTDPADFAAALITKALVSA